MSQLEFIANISSGYLFRCKIIGRRVEMIIVIFKISALVHFYELTLFCTFKFTFKPLNSQIEYSCTFPHIYASLHNYFINHVLVINVEQQSI